MAVMTAELADVKTANKTCCGCNKRWSVSAEHFCCIPGCPGCKIMCSTKGRCHCNVCDCGCQKDNDVREGKTRCYQSTSNVCPKCKTKCKDVQNGERCICFLCNCGCNGVNCGCCTWCAFNNCTGVCDREDKHSEKCKENKDSKSKEYESGKYYCDKHLDGKCIGGICDTIYYTTGTCRAKCQYCGTLCGQHVFFLQCTIGGPIIGIILVNIVVWLMWRDKALKAVDKMRRSFANRPGLFKTRWMTFENHSAYRYGITTTQKIKVHQLLSIIIYIKPIITSITIKNTDASKYDHINYDKGCTTLKPILTSPPTPITPDQPNKTNTMHITTYNRPSTGNTKNSKLGGRQVAVSDLTLRVVTQHQTLAEQVNCSHRHHLAPREHVAASQSQQLRQHETVCAE
ncbi:hypothetical protein BBBOND_0108490 [Babesia bigemina]|uniref:Uncharacterized protein n=1 Tax=Babesia bigemina TaxID=5866 RepID=A0A061D158_BABBI|nr:hypothetical protein BBBOND_0108490 [Babesia bigemina]CDR94551.1 hypothetical protein BBBOND_0108490 [Babesia bigemina]|eukprot:XP_012766737.1 hypothetical protein BBBOND_0108490 [Babesia bigemina]